MSVHDSDQLTLLADVLQGIGMPLAHGEIVKDFTQVRVAAAWLCDQPGIEKNDIHNLQE